MEKRECGGVKRIIRYTLVQRRVGRVILFMEACHKVPVAIHIELLLMVQLAHMLSFLSGRYWFTLHWTNYAICSKKNTCQSVEI